MSKRISAAILAMAMISVGFVLAVSVNVSAGDWIEEDFTPPWGPSFQPYDTAWNDEGDIWFVVGYHNDGLDNIWKYHTVTDSWTSYNMFAYQAFYGVCYDNVHDPPRFWFCGNTVGGSQSSVWCYIDGGWSYPNAGSPLHNDCRDIAVDHTGQPLVTCYMDSYMYYLDQGTDTWRGVYDASTYLVSCDMKGLTFNSFNQRFYAVGQYSGSHAIMFYTDPAPLDNVTYPTDVYCYKDFNPFSEGYGAYTSIEWNQMHHYGLVVGDSVVCTV
ncbi:MAG: hypothetical protein KAX31_01390, partial [Thermoplasmata archaeon]|nr:hypothetical protein [Thermoplasmata archaeon]